MTDLDWDMKFAMEQAADDAELFRELLKIFKQACAADLMSIRQGLDTNDPDRVYVAAHSMKGAAASLGFTTIMNLALDMEKGAKGGSLTVAQAGYNRLAGLVEAVQKL